MRYFTVIDYVDKHGYPASYISPTWGPVENALYDGWNSLRIVKALEWDKDIETVRFSIRKSEHGIEFA